MSAALNIIQSLLAGSGPSITSANCSFTLTIPQVYSSGVLLQNFAVDDMFDADPQTLVASRVGADGNSIYDYVYARTKMQISFQANSSSIPVFYLWKSQQDSQGSAITATGKIVSSSLGLDVNLTGGCLEGLALIPPHKRVAETLTVELTWDPSWQTTATGAAGVLGSLGSLAALL